MNAAVFIASSPTVDYEAVLRSDPCAYCGDRSTTVDHIRPRSAGGRDHWTNLTGSCRPCNEQKANVPLVWFLRVRLALRTAIHPRQRPRDLFTVVWPLHKHHYLTLWEGYRSPLAGLDVNRGHRSNHKYVQLYTLRGIEGSAIMRASKGGPNRSKSMRVFSVSTREWMRPHVEKYLTEIRRFTGVNPQRAAARILALDIDDALPILADMKYAEHHQPQATYRGQGSPMAKLTESDVRDIRIAYGSSNRPSQAALANRYGVSQSQIYAIVTGLSWRHI